MLESHTAPKGVSSGLQGEELLVGGLGTSPCTSSGLGYVPHHGQVTSPAPATQIRGALPSALAGAARAACHAVSLATSSASAHLLLQDQVVSIVGGGVSGPWGVLSVCKLAQRCHLGGPVCVPKGSDSSGSPSAGKADSQDSPRSGVSVAKDTVLGPRNLW